MRIAIARTLGGVLTTAALGLLFAPTCARADDKDEEIIKLRTRLERLEKAVARSADSKTASPGEAGGTNTPTAGAEGEGAPPGGSKEGADAAKKADDKKKD